MPPRRVVRIGPGCQAIRLPTGWWHLRFHDRSQTPKQRQRALDTDDEGIALSRARSLYEKRLAGLYDPWRGAGRALTVREAVNAYRADHRDRHRAHSIKVTTSSLLALERSMTARGDVQLRDIRPPALRAFVYRPHLSRTSQRSYWARLRAFFQWAVARGHVEANPVDQVPRPPPVQAGMKHLAPSDLDRLLIAVEEYHSVRGPIPEHVRTRDPYPLWSRDAFELLAGTGMRRGEAIALQWGDVVWPESSPWGVGYVVVKDEGRVGGRRTKSGKSRHVTMIPRTEELLRRLERETRRTSKPSETVLKGADGKRAVSPHTLSHSFRRYRVYAGLPDVPLHGLRHAYIIELITRGVPLPVVKEEAGHASVETTMGYVRFLPAERARMTASAFLDPSHSDPRSYENVPQIEVRGGTGRND